MIPTTMLESSRKRFAQEPGLLAAWLLGSAANSRLRDDSDIDFALYYEPTAEFDLDAYGQLLLDLESILGRTVDLGRINSHNLIYAEQATQRGKLIYEAKPKVAVVISTRVHALYLDLKLDRRMIEEAYSA